MCEWWLEKSRIQKRRLRVAINERTEVDEDVANEPKRKDSEEVLPREENVRTGKDMLHDPIFTPSFPLVPSPHTFSPPQIKSAPTPLLNPSITLSQLALSSPESLKPTDFHKTYKRVNPYSLNATTATLSHNHPQPSHNHQPATPSSRSHQSPFKHPSISHLD